jgi:hypothetical protein
MSARVKIRGIYSTALTRLLQDAGHTIVEASAEIRERFDLARSEGPPHVMIQDRDNLQGVDMTGDAEAICELLGLMQGRLLDAVFLKLESGEEEDGPVRARVEFPGRAKAILDKIRATVLPTLARHHLLRIVHPKGLERAEQELARRPQRKEETERELFREAILLPLEKSSSVRVEHVRASGRRVRPREGFVVECGTDRILMKRRLSRGRYDGLDLPIEEGDYALTEIRLDAWSVRHAYYSGSGLFKGEYHNVNSPVEFYPQGARYVDLEVDVVRRAGEAPFMVDQEMLAILAKEGFIGAWLEEKAREVAQDLLNSLSP